MTHSLKRSEALTDVQRARLDALYRIGKNCAHLQRIHLLGVTTVIGFLTPTSSVAGVTSPLDQLRPSSPPGGQSV